MWSYFGCYYFYGDEEEENRGAVSLRILFRTLFYNWGSLIFGSLFTPFTDFMTCCLKRSSRRTSEISKNVVLLNDVLVLFVYVVVDGYHHLQKLLIAMLLFRLASVANHFMNQQ